jgi:hypothetical protein
MGSGRLPLCAPPPLRRDLPNRVRNSPKTQISLHAPAFVFEQRVVGVSTTPVYPCLPPFTLVYPPARARVRVVRTCPLLSFACAVRVRHRPFAMFHVCRARDPCTLINHFAIILD